MPPSPPMMAHLLSLGTQSKDAAQTLKTESYICACVCACARLCVYVYVTESERQQDGDRTGSLISYNCCMSEHVFVSLCLSQVRLPSR